jgi:hypothetical protein
MENKGREEREKDGRHCRWQCGGRGSTPPEAEVSSSASHRGKSAREARLVPLWEAEELTPLWEAEVSSTYVSSLIVLLVILHFTTVLYY